MRLIFLFVALASAACSKDITKYHLETFGSIHYNTAGVAHIVTPKGWVAIDKNKKVLYTPYVIDNGPDYYSEGLMRYIENGKVGFVDEAGKIVIPAQFTMAFPFENSRARVCQGCETREDGEHSYVDPKTGKWGKIDRHGKAVD